MIFRAARNSNRGRMMTVPPDSSEQIITQVMAYIWNKGKAATSTSASFSLASQCLVWQALVTRFACVSIAPFEVPVVPPVYCRQAMSEAIKPDGFDWEPCRRISTHSWLVG